MLMFRVFSFLCLVLGSVSMHAAEGESSERLAGSFGDWSKICVAEDGGEACHISQTVNQNNSESRLFQTSIGYVGDAITPVVFLSAPLGIYLPRGITLELTETTLLSAVVQRCDGNGCLAVTSIDPSFLAEMLRVKEGRLIFGSSAEQNVAIPISFDGFNDALNSIKPEA